MLTPYNHSDCVHIVIDIETLGKPAKRNAVIMSIGAAAFHPDCGIIDSKLFVLPVAPQLQKGRIIDNDTMTFWAKQEDNTWAGQLDWGGRESLLYTELSAFRTYLHKGRPEGKVFIWANSPEFDLVNLETLFDDFDTPAPWGYRDLRSVRNAQDDIFAAGVAIPFEGAPHFALDDARHEAKIVLESIRLKMEG